jgi:hypothetical protein
LDFKNFKMANGHGGARKGAGAKKGVQREATKKAHEAIALAFENIGGVKALTAWARSNPDAFYERVWPKIIPVQLNHADADGEKLDGFKVILVGKAG